jgi:hypothetical protein
VLLIAIKVVFAHHIGVQTAGGAQLADLSKVMKDGGTDFVLRSAGTDLVDKMLDRVVVAGPEQLE